MTSAAKEMIQKSMEAKRFNESHRLISSSTLMLLVISLALIVAMLILVRAFACAYLPEDISVPVYDCFWLSTASFIVRNWIDYTGRGLMVTFKRIRTYLKS